MGKERDGEAKSEREEDVEEDEICEARRFVRSSESERIEEEGKEVD